MNILFSLNVSLLIFFINALSITCGDYDDLLKEDQLNTEADNYQYDHHAILGIGQSSIFDKLTPDESKAKLSVIIDQMDLDHNEMIDIFELKAWIKNVFGKIIDDDVEAQWKDFNRENAEKIDFQTYLKYAFKGGIDDERMPLVKLEERRWHVADLDKDGLLNKTELFRFLHPEEFKDMKPLLAQESLNELDKNNDGYVDIDEYMKEVFPEGRETKEEWIRHERQNFGIDRDLNKDGFLDQQEIQNWLIPDNYDRAETEAEHIMHKAGAGIEKVLTKQNILDKYYIFVGSKSDQSHSDYLSHEDL